MKSESLLIDATKLLFDNPLIGCNTKTVRPRICRSCFISAVTQCSQWTSRHTAHEAGHIKTGLKGGHQSNTHPHLKFQQCSCIAAGLTILQSDTVWKDSFGAKHCLSPH